MTLDGDPLLELLEHDLREAQQCVNEYAEMNDRCQEFVCHHSSYLAFCYLQRKGHDYLNWMNGYYVCNPPAPSIRHSWISSFAHDCFFVCETESCQLYDKGNYPDDKMPPGQFGGAFVLIDPAVVSRYRLLPDYKPLTRKVKQELDRIADSLEPWWEQN